MAKSIGPRRWPVVFERRDSGVNSFGQPVDTWATLSTVWGEVKTLAGRELATAREVRPETSVRIEIRARECDVTAADRVNFNGRILQILAAFDPEERGRILWLDCSEWKGASGGGA